jgi:hypothetical protein
MAGPGRFLIGRRVVDAPFWANGRGLPENRAYRIMAGVDFLTIIIERGIEKR